MPFLQEDFQGINILNIAGRDIVLNSKDAKSYIDFKTDKAFEQNVNPAQDIWLFVLHWQGMSLSLWPCREDEKCFTLKSK